MQIKKILDLDKKITDQEKYCSNLQQQKKNMLKVFNIEGWVETSEFNLGSHYYSNKSSHPMVNVIFDGLSFDFKYIDALISTEENVYNDLIKQRTDIEKYLEQYIGI